MEAADFQSEEKHRDLRDYMRRRHLLDLALSREKDEGKRRQAFEALSDGASPAVRAQLMKRLQNKPRAPKSNPDGGYAKGLQRDLGKVMSFKVGQHVQHDEFGMEGIVVAAAVGRIEVQRTVNGARTGEYLVVPVQFIDGWRGKDG